MADGIARSYEHWVAVFERHAGVRWHPRTVLYRNEAGEWRSALAEEVEYEPTRGILTYYFDASHPGIIYLGKVVGDGRYWRTRIHELARLHGCDVIESITYRNPETWKRKYNGEIHGHIIRCPVEGFMNDEEVLL
jgi:hypothetical protein